MALSFAAASDGLGPRTGSLGALKYSLTTVTFDSSYPTGGEAIAASDVGLSRIDGVFGAVNTAGSRLFGWDQTNQKMKVFTALGTEAANASDQSSISATFLFLGV